MNSPRLAVSACLLVATLAGCASTAPERSSVQAEEATNRETFVRYLEGVWNEGSYDLIPELVRPQSVLFANGQRYEADLAQHRRVVEVWHEAFPDFRFHIDRVMAEGDRVYARLRYTGTHSAPWFGIPATGREIEVAEMLECRFVEGKIAECWETYDEAGMRRQLGLEEL